MRSLLAFILLIAVAPAAPVPKAVKKKADDATLIVGTWEPVEGHREWFEFTAGGGVKAWGKDETAATGLDYTWAVDPTTSPKRITFSSPVTKTPSWEGVCELDGDTFRVTYVPAKRELPTEVGPSPGTNFCHLRRHTPDK